MNLANKQPVAVMAYPGALDDPSIPLLIDSSGTGVHIAQYLGYPVCCHNYFWSDRRKLMGPISAIEERLGFIGTGYRACLECQKLSMKEVYEGICARRLEASPFPLEPDDLTTYNPYYILAISEFVERLLAAGATPQQALLDNLERMRAASAA